MTEPRCPHCGENDMSIVVYNKVIKVTEKGRIGKEKEREDEHFLCYACDTEFDLESLLEATFEDDDESEEEEEEGEEDAA